MARSAAERDELASKLNEQFALVGLLRREKEQLVNSLSTKSHTDDSTSAALSELQTRLENEVDSKRDLQAKLDAMDTSTVATELKNQLSELQQLTQVRDELFKESEGKLKQLTEEVNVKNDKVAALESSEKALQQRVDDLQAELTSARTQIEELKESMLATPATTAVDAADASSSAVDATGVSVQELQTLLKEKEAQIATLEDRVKKNKVILAKAHQHITESTKQQAEGKSEIAKLKTEKDELANKIAQLERAQQRIVDEAVREQTKIQLEKHINVLVRQQREKESEYVRLGFFF
jgi:chromosome segregation ATPase